MNLTGRLGAAADLVPIGKCIADIGTDHGYIPVYLCESGICPQAVAADIAAGPLRAAQAHVRAAGLQDHIDCRLSDGLHCLSPYEVEGVVICGMGGPLMQRILEEAGSVWNSLQFLVLQPMSGCGSVRRFLYESGWHIDAEELVREDGRLYEVLRAVPGQRELLPLWMYDVGPVNWAEKAALLSDLIDKIIRRKQHILEGLRRSRRNMTMQIQVLEDEIKSWEERKWQCS
ncbi:tRNA (adenine(22)-N(1))-methyltransferase [Megasphaera cerevisiae]|jgi:tRNA (adenine22-N1)-methyltransferase|uniref:tRNA (adenine(22)-N(1))-methyltransferase n=1 Tax=Megasphaera cerevisiae TaxID=39029 RepID=UPI000944BBCE|nr:class I SAM-dependent methyltransferase [Megasphaera cerevisiae]MCI1750813.1 class I SAM-dependent methyltransferase [Megasphaera cerevisiae]OKY53795.1 hypothetical protein BSR42_05540 [Megasphaera cerevisiae]